MRGNQENQASVFCYVMPEERVPQNHPLRKIKKYADLALKKLSSKFDTIYSHTGRPSIPPEMLLKSQILMALYSVRSDRLFCEMLDYNILFHWFLDMDMEKPSFDASVFSKNRERLMEKEIAHKFLQEVVQIARDAELLSDEHFTTDGTLIEAWASMKSFVKKGGESPQNQDDDPGNPNVDFHGEKRKNETHQSTTDPEALLMKKAKGQEAKLSFCGTALMENRHGLCIDIDVDQARKTAEKEASLAMIKKENRRSKNQMKSVGADKGYCNKEFVGKMRKWGIKPHVAKIEKWRIPGLDGRTTQSQSFQISQRIRKRVEEIFGWCKTVGGLRKIRLRGVKRIKEQVCMVISTYNMLRMTKLASVTG